MAVPMSHRWDVDAVPQSALSHTWDTVPDITLRICGIITRV
jgi:hypothetical protein